MVVVVRRETAAVAAACKDLAQLVFAAVVHQVAQKVSILEQERSGSMMQLLRSQEAAGRAMHAVVQVERLGLVELTLLMSGVERAGWAHTCLRQMRIQVFAEMEVVHQSLEVRSFSASAHQP
jgi:hypothetical protein